MGCFFLLFRLNNFLWHWVQGGMSKLLRALDPAVGCALTLRRADPPQATGRGDAGTLPVLEISIGGVMGAPAPGGGTLARQKHYGRWQAAEGGGFLRVLDPVTTLHSLGVPGGQYGTSHSAMCSLCV